MWLHLNLLTISLLSFFVTAKTFTSSNAAKGMETNNGDDYTVNIQLMTFY